VIQAVICIAEKGIRSFFSRSHAYLSSLIITAGVFAFSVTIKDPPRIPVFIKILKQKQIAKKTAYSCRILSAFRISGRASDNCYKNTMQVFQLFPR